MRGPEAGPVSVSGRPEKHQALFRSTGPVSHTILRLCGRKHHPHGVLRKFLSLKSSPLGSPLLGLFWIIMNHTKRQTNLINQSTLVLVASVSYQIFFSIAWVREISGSG